jgi:hypothetical protein
MRIRLDYGSEGLEVELPDRHLATIIEPSFVPPIDNPHAALIAALRAPIESPPLREIVRPGQKIAISACDITRAQPREAMVNALFEEMPGVRPEDVTVLNRHGHASRQHPRPTRSPNSKACLAAISWRATPSSITRAATTRPLRTSARRLQGRVAQGIAPQRIGWPEVVTYLRLCDERSKGQRSRLWCIDRFPVRNGLSFNKRIVPISPVLREP